MRAFPWGLWAMALLMPTAAAGAPLPQHEIEMGRSAARDMEQRYGLVTDAGPNERIARLGAAMARASGSQVAFQFRILNFDEPNAITLPGGFIYVTRGLLKLLPEDALLSAALGHEVAHIALGHISDMLREQAEADGRVSAGVGTAKSDRTPAPSRTETPMQTREKAADVAAVRYLRAVNADPRVMVTLLRRLSEQPELNANGSTTHPTWPDRIRALEAYLTNTGTRAGGLVTGASQAAPPAAGSGQQPAAASR